RRRGCQPISTGCIAHGANRSSLAANRLIGEARLYILGINAYHGGASACLIEDGRLIAAAEEERFTRVKYWAGFPVKAIEFVLSEAGITARDLDHVGISIDPKANIMQKALFAFRNRPTLGFVRDRL